MSGDDVNDIGFSVVYTPEDCDPVVDVVFVHGLGGHPYRTWAWNLDPSARKDCSNDPRPHDFSRSQKRRSYLRRVLHKVGLRSRTTVRSQTDGLGEASTAANDAIGPDGGTVYGAETVFWPGHLLPKQLPRARILTWGYDSHPVKGPGMRTDQGTIFSHGRNLIIGLESERGDVDFTRPLVFVAHSLGGIIVKEALSYAIRVMQSGLVELVKSTTAVVFLGTPHRGSAEWSGLGEMARKIASALLIDNNPAILDSLGLKNDELRSCHEAFVGIWDSHGFIVKTFQESKPLIGISLGRLNELAVPQDSASIGNPKERTQILNADHIEMCKFFGGSKDANYRIVRGAMVQIYKDVLREIEDHQKQTTDIPEPQSSQKISVDTKNRLRVLHFSGMFTREQTIHAPMRGTCEWLFQHRKYRRWCNGQNVNGNSGILWIKGKPGSGKSTLMKNAVKDVEKASSGTLNRVASFFFDASGNELQKSPIGLFRSLIFQLLPYFPVQAAGFADELDKGRHEPWHEADLRSVLSSLFESPFKGQTTIFIDSLDECTGNGPREIALYLIELTKGASHAGANLKICFSSRIYSQITVGNCINLVVDELNDFDIAHFVRQRFMDYGNQVKESDQNRWFGLQESIIRRSEGIFLWVNLVVNEILDHHNRGKGMEYLETCLESIPRRLEPLFAQLLGNLPPQDVQIASKFFQWILLSARPLTIPEWYDVFAMITTPSPKSLVEWKTSEHYIENDEQFEKTIRYLSKGLVELKTHSVPTTAGKPVDLPESASICAGAGSMDLEQEGVKIVKFIHESVRVFFHTGKGFSSIHQNSQSHAGRNPEAHLGEGHLTILGACFDYINVTEVDALVEARMKATSEYSSDVWDKLSFRDSEGHGKRRRREVLRRRLSDASFGSSASSYANNGGHERLEEQRGDIPAGFGTGTFAESIMDGFLRGIRESSISDFSNFSYPSSLTESFCNVSVSKDPWHSSVDPGMEYESEILPPRRLGESPTHFTYAKEAPRKTNSSIKSDAPVQIHIPLLLHYCLEKLVFHAVRAEEYEADPSSLIQRLDESITWSRWVCLKEGIPRSTSLLCFASSKNLASWVRVLLTETSDDSSVRILECFNESVFAAANQGHGEVLCLLMEHAPHLFYSTRDEKERTVLHHIAAHSETHSLHKILKRAAETPWGHCINKRDIYGQAPLHIAVWQGDKGMLDDLLKHGADPTAQDGNGDTPLHVLCERERVDLEVCRSLLGASVNLNIRNENGLTAIDIARKKDCNKVVQLLSQHSGRRKSLMSGKK